MARANKHRGEVAVTLAGKEYTLRPTYEAIAAFEEATGRGALALARMAATGDIGVAKAAMIIHAAQIASGGKVTLPAIGKAVVETGLPNVLPAVVEFLTNCLMGGSEPGEAKAAEAETG